jgi:hypothetical protein
MQLGTWGEIHATFVPAVVNESGKVVKPERWRAYALYRGYDGHTSQVERKDTSQDAATERLKGTPSRPRQVASQAQRSHSNRD